MPDIFGSKQYFNLSSPTTQSDAQNRLTELEGYINALQQEIKDAKTAKEYAGAELLRCHQSSKNIPNFDCSDVQYVFDTVSGEYDEKQKLLQEAKKEKADLKLFVEELKKEKKFDQVAYEPKFGVDMSNPNLTLGNRAGRSFMNATEQATPEPANWSDNTIIIFGKEFTYKELFTFVGSLVLVSFALAFPLENPLKQK